MANIDNPLTVISNIYPYNWSWKGTLYSAFYAVAFPTGTELTVTAPFSATGKKYQYDFKSAFYGVTGAKKITVNAAFSPTSMYEMFNCYGHTSSIEEICLNFSTNSCTSFGPVFQACGRSESDGGWSLTGTPLDTSAVTSGTLNMFGFSNGIKEVRFAQSTILTNIQFSSSKALSDASIVSIANGLNSSVASKSLTFHATPKARCSTLMGTVTDGVFTQDDTGTVSLQTFITDTKGWTLA